MRAIESDSLLLTQSDRLCGAGFWKSMKLRSILRRSVFVVVALTVVYVAVAVTYNLHTRTDAVSAVRDAIEAHLAGQESTKLTFDDEKSFGGSFDTEEFVADVGTGYELKFAERWLTAYDVEIVTGNGRRYVASPMWRTTHHYDGEETSE